MVRGFPHLNNQIQNNKNLRTERKHKPKKSKPLIHNFKISVQVSFADHGYDLLLPGMTMRSTEASPTPSYVSV